MENVTYSTQAEKAILGAIFLDNEALPTVSSLIGFSDFHHEKHRIIYSAIETLAASGEPIDLITVTHELSKVGLLEEVGGTPYLMEIIEFVPTAMNVVSYCRIVKVLSEKRVA